MIQASRVLGSLMLQASVLMTLAVLLAGVAGCTMSNHCIARDEAVLTSGATTRPQAADGFGLLRVETDGTVILQSHTQTITCKPGQTVPLTSDSTVRVESSDPARQQAKVVIERTYTIRPVWF